MFGSHYEPDPVYISVCACAFKGEVEANHEKHHVEVLI